MTLFSSISWPPYVPSSELRLVWNAGCAYTGSVPTQELCALLGIIDVAADQSLIGRIRA